tara:strand:+ start:2048 stop:2503 length:456 start_codon:yes stop_codon:yes gene_type:complete
MAIRYSTGLKNAILDTGSLKDALDDGVLRFYSGTVPADADAALGSAVLLNEYTDDGQALAGGTGLDFDAAAVGGALGKAPAQTWEGDAVANGDASFFRFVTQADTGAASTTEIRIQGTVGGVGADMFVQSVTFVTSTTYTVDYFSVAIPDL